MAWFQILGDVMKCFGNIVVLGQQQGAKKR
jgi:hypothetical protein